MCINFLWEHIKHIQKVSSVENLYVFSLNNDKLLAHFISSVPYLRLFRSRFLTCHFICKYFSEYL